MNDKIICQECHRVFCSHYSLKRHIERYHLDDNVPKNKSKINTRSKLRELLLLVEALQNKEKLYVNEIDDLKQNFKFTVRILFLLTIKF